MNTPTQADLNLFNRLPDRPALHIAGMMYTDHVWNEMLDLTVIAHHENGTFVNTNRDGTDITDVDQLIEHIQNLLEWSVINRAEFIDLRAQALRLSVPTDLVFADDSLYPWARV